MNTVIDQSRKRGTLESDLLLSTFANSNLTTMSLEQLKEYDQFLDENDWDIYYWATQQPSPTSRETAEGAAESTEGANAVSKGLDIKDKKQSSPQPETDAWRNGPRSGEWAQTVGTFKPAYRPVPARWKDSHILQRLRAHVIHKSAGGTTEKYGQGEKEAGGGGKQSHRRKSES